MVGAPESGRMEGQHAAYGDGHGHGSTEANQLGTGDECDQSAFELDDTTVKVEAIIERFVAHPSIRMKAKSTQTTYSCMFRRFAKAAQLEDYSRRQLAGAKGQRLILEHIVDNIPIRSRKSTLSGIEKVWKFGLNLPWPIDNDRDIGKLPRSKRRFTPHDDIVRAWNDRMVLEPSPYLRVQWLLLAQSGQRPQTISKLRWHHVRYEQNKPCDIRVNGADEELKTFADVAMRLPPDLSDALVELRKWLKDPGANDPVLPWFDGWGALERTRSTSPYLIRSHMERLARKYGLPKLLPCEMRHWVTSKCREEPRLHEQARAFLQGHEQQIRDMGDHYDNCDVETNLARQAEKFPYGPLGVFTQPKVEIMGDLPSDIVATLLEYRDNNKGITEVTNMLEQWRLTAKQEVAFKPIEKGHL